MKKKHYSVVFSSPIGKLGIVMQASAVTAVDFVDDEIPDRHDVIAAPITAALSDYFSNPAHAFNLERNAAGTPFQQRVWNALCDIPSGTTLTYGELAKKLNSSPRAVGQACRRNPTPIIVPCHRVIAAGDIGGYAGDRGGKLLEIKKWLLQHENVNRSPYGQSNRVLR